MDAITLLANYLHRLEMRFPAEEIEQAVVSAGQSRRRAPGRAREPRPGMPPAQAALEGFLARWEKRGGADVDEAVQSLAQSILRSRTGNSRQRPDVKLRICKWCLFEGKSKEMLVHRPRCPLRPRLRAPGAGRPPVLRKCRWCHLEMPTQDRIIHEPICPKKPVKAAA